MISINLKWLVSIFCACIVVLSVPVSVEADITVDESLEQQKDQSQEQQDISSENEEGSGSPEVEAPSLLGSFIQLLLALAVVIGLIIFVSKFIQKKKGFLKKHNVIENYGGITVGANKSIQTVKIGNRYYVIGVADNIELLMEITDDDTIAQLERQQDEMTDSLKNMALKLRNKSPETKKETTKDQTFSSLFNKELNTMKEGRQKLLHKLKEGKKNNDDSAD
ncbi:flagellar biosynthetic protein FliO [Gracilibacillus caseinilyticus]|uniref:Flagellar biosynthetic protein FliO n=1 Tax=Gracilibacillus caseinilyticus TaxID=2932256 RepID=A0ABY4EU59_9BACI|nr:flagellar biosynthetic protein FliO [Gracilibacillus caseinilyticus]UOQ47865.1 flagellar biosynthetic protein FliO [Gracilibacillus caseinilyticus]